MRLIDNKISQLSDLIIEIKRLCDKIGNTKGNFKASSCEAIQVFGKEFLKKIDQERVNISDFLKVRNKRALVGVIGSILKELIGTMDESDFKDISEHLQNNSNELKNQEFLLKKQIQTLKHEFNVLNGTLGDVAYNKKLIDNQSRKINEIIEKNYLNSRYNHTNVELDGNMNGLEALFATMGSLLLVEIGEIEECIIDFKNGIVNTKLFKMRVIIENLKKALEHLPEGLSFPFELNAESGVDITNSIVKLHTVLDDDMVHFMLEDARRGCGFA